MKKLVAIFTVIFLSSLTANALVKNQGSLEKHGNDYGDAFIFIENGITFSVFPDGEFDFYIDNPSYFGASIASGNVNISFNSGYRYDAYVQYDDYGAVIQIENTPVYYDFYGRVSRIGSVDIYYNSGRLARIGGLYVHYNPYGAYTHYTGYINVYNRNYVYRPFHRYFTRPVVNLCIVNNRPYRRYYSPVRYSYYKPYKNNNRRAYATIGRTYHYRDNPGRDKVYRNDRRVSSRNDMAISNNIRRRSLETESRRETVSRRSNNGSDINRDSNTRINRDVTPYRSSNSRREVHEPKKRVQESIRKNEPNADRKNNSEGRRTEAKTRSQAPQRTVQKNESKNTVQRSSSHSNENKNVQRAPQRSIERKSESTRGNSRTVESRRGGGNI